MDGDSQLSFDEFKKMVFSLPDDPKVTEKQVRQVFNDADADGDGQITMDEYFAWSIANASQEMTSGFITIFNFYDKNKDGSLTIDEFAHAIERLGFPVSMGEVFFHECDTDNSGSLSVNEIMTRISAKTRIGRSSKRLVVSLACGDVSRKRITSGEAGPDNLLDVSEWPPLEATTAAELRSEIVARLLPKQSSRDVFKLCIAQQVAQGETGGGMELHHFMQAMLKLGHCGPNETLANIFKEIDDDSSGLIGIAEFLNWLNQGRADSVPVDPKSVTLSTRRAANETPFDEQSWSPSTLRQELQQMLARNGLTPLDLMEAYEIRQGKPFSKKKFLNMCKKLVNNKELWGEALRITVLEVFELISGGDGDIDVNEFTKWIRRGFDEIKKDVNKRLFTRVFCNENKPAISLPTPVTGNEVDDDDDDEAEQVAGGGQRRAGVHFAGSGDEPAGRKALDTDEKLAMEPQLIRPESAPGNNPEPQPTRPESAPSSNPGRAKGLPKKTKSMKEVDQALRESQIRLARALMDAGKVLGFDALSDVQKAEISTLEDKFGPGTLNDPIDFERKVRAGLPSVPFDDDVPSRPSAISASIVDMSRVRMSSVHDQWDGRDPRRLMRASSAPLSHHHRASTSRHLSGIGGGPHHGPHTPTLVATRPLVKPPRTQPSISPAARELRERPAPWMPVKSQPMPSAGPAARPASPWMWLYAQNVPAPTPRLTAALRHSPHRHSPRHKKAPGLHHRQQPEM